MQDVYADLARDIETRFYTSNYEIKRLPPIGKNQKVIRLTKDDLGGKIMKEIVALRPRIYKYLIDDAHVDKKKAKKKTQKRAQNSVKKQEIKFQDYRVFGGK